MRTSVTPGPGPQAALPVRRKLRSRPTFRIIALVLLVFLGWTAWSVEHALTAPGGGTVSERLAEWARDHYLGPVVTFAEWVMYTPPKVGGQPSFSLAMPTTGPPRGPAGTSITITRTSTRSPAPGSAARTS